jgi:predicted ArsR family transcriptional regulator
MAENRYTIERSKRILELIEQVGPMTNMDIAASLGLKYRTVQRSTYKLAQEGLITGYINSFGGVYSNVSWRVRPTH